MDPRIHSLVLFPHMDPDLHIPRALPLDGAGVEVFQGVLHLLLPRDLLRVDAKKSVVVLYQVLHNFAFRTSDLVRLG